MTANEPEKPRLGILDEAEQRKGTAFSIIALAVLASALWLFFNFRDQEAAEYLCGAWRWYCNSADQILRLGSLAK